MTQREFRLKMPDILYHKSWGYAELEFTKFPKPDCRVGVLYRHRSKASSYGTIKNSWQEIYDDLAPLLEKDGHMDFFINNSNKPISDSSLSYVHRV